MMATERHVNPGSQGMSVSVDEHRLGSLRWIVVSGPDLEAFRALGEHVRAELAALTEAWPVLPRLRRHVSGPPGRERLAAVHQATAQTFGAERAELAAFAAGAAVPFDDLALLNVRGDLGLIEGGIGCSDLAWRRERSVIAHNEDGVPEDVGRCALLTLTGNGRPPVTAFWYPGFLPANAFAVTGDGLLWTIDHLPVAVPGAGAGRHFVGRGLQRSARTVQAAVDYLRTHASAGGFAYTIGDRAGRVVSVEAAAGRHASVEAGPGHQGPVLWHTNHGRYVPGAEAPAQGSSVTRGQALEALDIPAEDPDPSWFLRALTGPPPDGVRADPAPGRRGTTLCTLVADLTAGEAVIVARDEQPVAIPLPDLAEGNPRAQRPSAPSVQAGFAGPASNPACPLL
jgi:Acyl-coenzyme A:6-aminopenicillanic acid acyl-transferase